MVGCLLLAQDHAVELSALVQVSEDLVYVQPLQLGLKTSPNRCICTRTAVCARSSKKCESSEQAGWLRLRAVFRCHKIVSALLQLISCPYLWEEKAVGRLYGGCDCNLSVLLSPPQAIDIDIGPSPQPCVLACSWRYHNPDDQRCRNSPQWIQLLEVIRERKLQIISSIGYFSELR